LQHLWILNKKLALQTRKLNFRDIPGPGYYEKETKKEGLVYSFSKQPRKLEGERRRVFDSIDPSKQVRQQVICSMGLRNSDASNSKR
jgi:hypothetical protein